MNKFIFIVVACWLLSLGGCSKPGCIGGAGNMISVSRTLQPFNTIVLEDNIDLHIIQDNTERIVIDGPENIVQNIATYIVGNSITITNETDCRWIRKADEKVRVELHCKTLNKIDYRGSGNITNQDTIRSNALQVESALGAGNLELTVDNDYTGAYIFQESASMTFHGRSNRCFTYTNSRGTMHLEDMEVKKMVIEYGGLSDTQVRVTEELDAIIYYKGSILYRGNPVITQSTYYSSGKLIKQP